ncbi:MAG: hypothetical protein ACPG1A_16560, partial [Halioglobus sp.]
MSERLLRTSTPDGAPSEPGEPDPAGMAWRYWRFEDVLQQPLHGNVHLVPGAPTAGRLTRAAEARGLAMASCGLRTMADMVVHEMVAGGAGAAPAAEWKIMETEDAMIVHEGLSQADYEAIVASIPEEWKFALRQGERTTWYEGDVITNAKARPVLRVTLPPQRLRPGRADVLEWRGATSRLVETGESVQIHHANNTLSERVVTRHVPLPVDTEEDMERLTAPENALHPQAIALAEAMRLRLQAVGTRGQRAAEDTQKIGYVRPCTVRMPRLAALGSATTARLYSLKSAQVWQPMRTIDARQARAHYLPWIQPHPPALQQRIVAKWVDITRASYLPGRALDLYKRRL